MSLYLLEILKQTNQHFPLRAVNCVTVRNRYDMNLLSFFAGVSLTPVTSWLIVMRSERRSDCQCSVSVQTGVPLSLVRGEHLFPLLSLDTHQSPSHTQRRPAIPCISPLSALTFMEAEMFCLRVTVDRHASRANTLKLLWAKTKAYTHILYVFTFLFLFGFHLFQHPPSEHTHTHTEQHTLLLWLLLSEIIGLGWQHQWDRPVFEAFVLHMLSDMRSQYNES